MNNPTGLVPETELNPYSLDAYVTEKVRNQNNINKASILNLGKNAINTKLQKCEVWLVFDWYIERAISDEKSHWGT